MQRHACKMRLNLGMEGECTRSHYGIGPELVHLLHATGVANYSIHLDRETMILFGYLERIDNHRMRDQPNHPVMKTWRVYLSGIMATNCDGSPVVFPLTETF